MGSVEGKFKAFGWEVLTVEAGNDLVVIGNALREAKSMSWQWETHLALLKTEMGNGVDFMMHTHAWHGKAPNDEQLESAFSTKP